VNVRPESNPFFRQINPTTLVCLVWFFLATGAAIAGEPPKIELIGSRIGPRTLEPITAKNIVRDYGRAWEVLSTAYDQNSALPLASYFAGAAQQNLTDAINSGNKSGLHRRYRDISHRLQPLFYSPEGDLLEFRDTAQLHLQILDGDKVIHEEETQLQYVVLMTPAADKWVVRLLETVPQSRSIADQNK